MLIIRMGKNGEYRKWYKDGQLEIDAKYKNGRIIYRYEYDENGNKLE